MKPSNTILVLYRFRWPLALLALAVTFFLMNTGMGQVGAFSDRVTSLRSVPPEVSPPPRMFDPRTDIWFDPEDSGLKTFYEVEDKFIAEDIVVIAFEETEDPWGVFGTKALTTIAELSSAIEKVPGVRNVRSLTTNPWIRFGEAGPGEEGLIVGDLFERDPNSYSEDERLERMIAIVGAENAANRIGEERVKALLGSSADFSNYIGEPRLLDAVVNAEASTTALMISILRPRPSPDELDSAFADAPPRERDVGPAIHVMETQAETVGAIERILAEHPEYAFHSAGIPLFEREFFRVGQSDMAYVGLMFVAIGLILSLIFRRVGAVAVPLLIVFMSIMAMVGTIFTLGDLLNNLTAAAPVMVTAVGIADAVHLITSYYLLRPQYDDKHALISAVLAKNALPVFLTSLTTSIGFFSLMTGEIIPIQMLGYAAGVGTISAYLLSMTVIPAMLSLLPLSKSQAPKSQAPKNKERSSAENTGSGAGEELKPAEATRGDEQNASPLWADRLVALVLRHRVPFISGAVLTIALSIFGMSRIEMSSDMRMMFPADNRIISDVHWIEARLGGASDLEIIFNGPPIDANEEQLRQSAARLEELELRQLSSESTMSSTERAELRTLRAQRDEVRRRRIATSQRFLEQIDGFQTRLQEEAKNPESPLRVLSNFDSAIAVLRKMHQVQNENEANYYRVPDENDVPEQARRPVVQYDDILEESSLIPGQDASTLVSQYYLQYENGAKPAENLSTLVSSDRQSFRIQVRTRTAATSVLLAAFDRIREILSTEFPELDGNEATVESGEAYASATLTGKQYLFTNMFQSFSNTLIVSLTTALIAITLVIAVVYRSIWIALISLVPNVLPIVIPLGFFGLVGKPLDGPAVIVATVALGVCVDDTIHFLTKFTRSRLTMNIEDALRATFREVGPALTWTTMVLVAGFGVLSLSTFRPNMLIGVLGAIIVALAWAADFLVTPAILSYLDRSEPEQVLQPQPAE